MKPFAPDSISSLTDALTAIHRAAIKEGSLGNFRGARTLFDWCETIHALKENGEIYNDTPVAPPAAAPGPSPPPTTAPGIR